MTPFNESLVTLKKNNNNEMSAHIKTLIKYIFLWSLLTADDSVGSLAFKK